MLFTGCQEMLTDSSSPESPQIMGTKLGTDGVRFSEGEAKAASAAVAERQRDFRKEVEADRQEMITIHLQFQDNTVEHLVLFYFPRAAFIWSLFRLFPQLSASLGAFLPPLL